MFSKTLSWLTCGASLAISLIFIGYFYRGETLSLFKIWQGEEYSHAFLLVPLALLWGWTSIEKAGAIIQPFPAGLVVVGASLFVNIIGMLLANTWLANIAVVLSLLGLCLTFLGRRATLAAWKGFALLFFAIPLPPIMMAGLTAKMQLVSSSLGSALLEGLSYSVYQEGNVLDLGVIKLQVAEACSGLRYFFPLFSLGFLAAFLFKIAGWMRLVIIVSTLPISIVMNALRIATIGVAANIWGQEIALGLIHDLEGWVVFAFCLLFLAIEIWGLSLLMKKPLVMEDFLPSGKKGIICAASKPSILTGLLLIAVIVCGVSSKAYLQHRRDTTAVEEVSFTNFPLTIGSWKGRTKVLSKEELSALRLTDYFLADYTNENAKFPADEAINFYIAYYANQRLGSAPHSPKVCLPGNGWEISLYDSYHFTLSTTSKRITVNRAVIRKGDAIRLVYFWLRERGHDVTSTLEVKWRLLTDALKSGRSDGALIRVIIPVPNITRINEQDQVLQEFISDAWESMNTFVSESPNDQ